MTELLDELRADAEAEFAAAHEEAAATAASARRLMLGVGGWATP